MEAEIKVIHAIVSQTIIPDLFKMSVMVFACVKCCTDLKSLWILASYTLG